MDYRARAIIVVGCFLFCGCAGWERVQCELGICNHGDVIATRAAAQELQCAPENLRMERIKSYVYEVAGCDQFAYYRCWYLRHGSGQCCTRVGKEDLATIWVNPYAGTQTCLSRDGEWSAIDWSASN